MRIALLLAATVAGPALQLQQPSLWPAPSYLVLGGASLAMGLIAARTTLGWARTIGLALALATLAGAGTGWRAARYAAEGLQPALEGRDLVLTGVVAAMPQRGEAGLRFRFEVESARAGPEAVAVPSRVLLGWYRGMEPRPAGGADLQRQPAELRPGERWQLAVRLKAPHGNVNPHGFDYELWLWEQGLQATGYVRAGPRDSPPRRLETTWQHPVEGLRHRVRDAIFERVADARLAGVLAALVVGDQGAIERADWDVFRATGVAHLMSISGLHVTMFAWVAALAVGWAWRRSARLCLAWPAQHAAMAGGVVLATLYALFSGWGVPSQRTVWMLATVCLLRAGARQWPWPTVWLLACAVVVAIDPWTLQQAGFWLSFVAVGVLFATDRGLRPLGAKAHLLSLISEQAVVSVALTPLSLLLFGQVSLVGLVANLVAIPWVTLLVTPLAMVGILVPLAWDLAAWAVAILGAGLQGLASLPLATLSMAVPPLWAGIAGVLGGLLLAMPLPLSLRAFGLPLILPALLWQAPRPATGEFELLAADVGQGNAVIVRTAHHTLVYDAGPRYGPESDAGHRVLVPLLRSLDERVDKLVLSHRDTDHTGGAAAVLAMQSEATLLSSIEPGHELQRLRPATRCEAGQRWEWDGVRFEVLHPAPADYQGTPRPNALSCTVRVASASAVALLVGDIEQPQEAALLARAAASPAPGDGRQAEGGGLATPLRADLLLVPHHGSKTSSSAAFLDAVAPRLALVQAGYRNRFGHPAIDVVERYRARGVRLVLSPACGAATWQSARSGEVRCERVEARRYWQHVLDPAPRN